MSKPTIELPLAVALVAALTWTALAQQAPSSPTPEPAPAPEAPTTPAASEQAPAGRKLLKLEGANMPGAWFDHAIHDTGECVSCHHLGRTDQKCTECHTVIPQGEVPGAMQAFHDNCYRCHVKGGASNGKATTCEECHVE